MPYQKVFSLPDLAFPVTLEQDDDDLTFRVTYGVQVVAGLSYGDAAREFGLSVFHALACESKVALSPRLPASNHN